MTTNATTRASARSAATPVTARPRRAFQTDIEGLRAIAVLAVVAFHATVPGIAGGFAGVDVFFVISGYLITGQLMRELLSTGHIKLFGFYARRAKRLLPAASIVLVAVTIATALLEPLLGIYHAAQDILAAALYTSNWHFISLGTDYLAQSSAYSPVLHFWSLAVEEQFYLIWPLLLLGAAYFVRRMPLHGTRIFALVLGGVTVASLIAGLVLTTTEPKVAYMATQTRAWEFGIGALIALVAHWLTAQGSTAIGRTVGFVAGWAGLAAIGYAVLRFDNSTPFPGTAALVPTLGTAAIIAGGLLAGTGRGSIGSLLSLAPMRYLGRLSYAWYLWHWPVMVLVEVKTSTLSWQGRSLLMMIALLLAAATLHLIEMPISRWKTVARNIGPAFALGVFCMITVAAIVLGIGANAVNALGAAGTSVSPAQLQAAFGPSTVRNAGAVIPSALAAAADIPRPTACLLDHEKAVVAGCALGPINGLPVVLFGDSHANQWLPALSGMSTARNWRLTVFTKSGCPVPDIAPRKDGSRFSEPECVKWRQAAIDEITKSIKPALIVVSSLDNYIPDQGEVLTAWNVSLDKLRTQGAPIAYIRDSPIPSKDVPTCISSALDNWSKCSFKPLNKLEPVIQQTIIGNENKVTVVDMYKYFCSADTCPAVKNGVLLYRDDSHITATAAKALEPAFDQAFVSAGLIPKVKSTSNG